MALLTPDRYFSRISAIDIERDLLGCGLTHVLLDIDNTVRARDTGCVPRDVGMWLGRAREAGVGFCLLSNNWHADVYQFAGELDLPHTLLLRNVERVILGDRKPEPAINIAESEASRSAARRGQGSAPRRFGQGAQRGVEGASRETGRESL